MQISDKYNCNGTHFPCQNEGTCLELQPSFRCHCKRPYKGSLCEEGGVSVDRLILCKKDQFEKLNHAIHICFFLSESW